MSLAQLLSFALFLALAGAYDVTIDGQSPAIRNGWLTYTSSNNLPKCCKEANCKMVRLSTNLLNKVQKSADKLRFTLEDNNGKMTAIVSFNKALAGTVYMNDGNVYQLEAIPDKEANDISSPCYKKRYVKARKLFYRLNFVKKSDGNLPGLLVNVQAADSSDKACYGYFCHAVSSVNIDLLKSNGGDFSSIYIPRTQYPSQDTSAVFSFTGSQPSECREFCDVYFYSNDIGELVTIQKNGAASIALSLESLMGDDLTIKSASGNLLLTGKSPASGKHVIPVKPAASSGRVAPGELCWFPNYICEPNNYVKAWFPLEFDGRTDQEMIRECYDSFIECEECTYFTYVNLRDGPYCYLQTGCKVEYDYECFLRGKCASGPSDCSPLGANANCTSPPDLGPDYAKWQCVDRKAHRLGPVFPYTPLLPSTVCLQGCGSWRSEFSTPENPDHGYLISRCQNDGTWTVPKTVAGGASLEFPSAPYALPTAGVNESPAPLGCGCQDLTLRYHGAVYNPNDEEGADFQCTSPVQYSPITGFVIENGNVCHLLCDQVLAVTIMCTENGWTGSPDIGVYCYITPDQF